jgi:hypothetical protein
MDSARTQASRILYRDKGTREEARRGKRVRNEGITARNKKSRQARSKVVKQGRQGNRPQKKEGM